MNEKLKNTLVILAGPPLHGKTSAGKYIAEVTGLDAVDIDDLRSVYFPNILAEGGVRDRQGNYFLAGDAEVTTACYHLVIPTLGEKLKQGNSVVFTGALSKDIMKKPVLNIAKHNPEIRVVVVKIAGKLSQVAAEARIKSRLAEGSNSPIVSYSVYLETLKLQTAWPRTGPISYHEIDAGNTIEETGKKILAIL